MKRRDFVRHCVLATTATLVAAQGAFHFAQAAGLPPDPFYAHGFPDVEGRQHELTDYLGKPLVLNFWATWCPPCVKEMPDLQQLHDQYPEVGFIGLAADSAANILKFQEKVHVSYPLLVGGHGVIQLMRDLGNKAGGLPFTLVFNRHGQIVQRFLGQIKPVELEQLLRDMPS